MPCARLCWCAAAPTWTGTMPKKPEAKAVLEPDLPEEITAMRARNPKAAMAAATEAYLGTEDLIPTGSQRSLSPGRSGVA